MASTLAQSSLNNASAVGAGAAIDFLTAKKTVTGVVIPSAVLATGVVTIEASQDGTTFVVLRTVDLVGRAGPFAVSPVGVAFRHWRASIAVALTGGTVRVTFMEAD